MTIYDQRVEFWPKYAISSLNNKALDMYNYMKDEPEKLYEGLTYAISELGTEARTNLYLFQMNTAVDLYKDGKLDPESVINAYETAVANIAAMTPKNDVEKRSNEKTVSDIESLFITSQVASCDNLITLFTPRYEADPQNLDLAKNIVRMMGITEGCTDNDLFLNAVTVMHNMEPSHVSAYNLYKLYAGRADVENAIKYMTEAIENAESDAVTDGGYQYELAAFCYKNNQTVKAEAAAKAALELDLPTVGVLPCGIDEIYPAHHRELARRILDKGGVVTEFPPGSGVRKWHFLKRNRIIAGMSRATVVVESRIKGGAMRTAEYANSYDREVYAIPGRLCDTNSDGCNFLISRNMAQICTYSSFRESCGLGQSASPYGDNQKSLFLFESDKKEKILLSLKFDRPAAVETLCAETGFDWETVSVLLLELELEGKITVKNNTDYYLRR
jgi:tetratricopeptide (TPR) repeat protein